MGAPGAAGDPDVGRRLRAEGARGRRPRQGDGVIIQLADPDIIQWIMDTARQAAEEAGRDPSELKCIVSAPSHISDDLADAREQTRWFPAMVSNHVQDLIDRYGTDGSVVPKALTDYVEARKFYDYNEHSRVGAKHGEFVTDEICDRFSRARQRRAGDREAARARVDRRRPVQHLPDDPRAGGDARDLRPATSSRSSRGRGVERRDDVRRRWDAASQPAGRPSASLSRRSTRRSPRRFVGRSARSPASRARPCRRHGRHSSRCRCSARAGA